VGRGGPKKIRRGVTFIRQKNGGIERKKQRGPRGKKGFSEDTQRKSGGGEKTGAAGGPRAAEVRGKSKEEGRRKENWGVPAGTDF